VYSKCESQLRYIQESDQERQRMVNREEYERVKAVGEERQRELQEAREQVQRVRERFEKQTRELEEAERERKTQMISLLNCEQ